MPAWKLNKGGSTHLRKSQIPIQNQSQSPSANYPNDCNMPHDHDYDINGTKPRRRRHRSTILSNRFATMFSELFNDVVVTDVLL